MGSVHQQQYLPLKREIKIAADDTLIYFFTFIFRSKLGLIFHVNPLPSREDSHEILSPIFSVRIFKTVVCCSRDGRLKSSIS